MKKGYRDNSQGIFVGFILHFYLSYVGARNIYGKSKIFCIVKCFKLKMSPVVSFLCYFILFYNHNFVFNGPLNNHLRKH